MTIESNLVLQCLALLPFFIVPVNSCLSLSLDHLDLKLKSILDLVALVSHALGSLNVFSLSSLWLTDISTFILLCSEIIMLLASQHSIGMRFFGIRLHKGGLLW